MKPDDLDPAHFSRVHGARRARLAQAMQGGVAVIPTAPERIRNRDTHYPYRYDSHFYYLGGFPEPEAVLVYLAAPGRIEVIKMVRPCTDAASVIAEIRSGETSMP